MSKLSINLSSDQAVMLSESRLKSILSGDAQAIQRMGWFDKLRDTLGNHGSKQAALEKLAQDFDESHGTQALDRFRQLASMARPLDRSQFTLSVEGPFEQPSLVFRIKQYTVKTDSFAPNEREMLDARWGRVKGFDAADNPKAADWLGIFKQENLNDARNQLVDNAFQTGGKHKRFDVTTGVLRAEDATGALDFEREKLIAELANTKPELDRYVSTQKMIEPEKRHTLLPLVQSEKPHAVVTLYNPDHVVSHELDQALHTLTSGEAHSLLMQAVDMTRVFYKSAISHQDLHMHNLMVHKPLDANVGHITLKAIDFGKSKVSVDNEYDRLNDVRYLFLKQASSGTIETMRREARDLLRYDIDKQAKHYPLHKLLVQCARASGNNLFVNDHDFDDTIKATGERLVDALKQSELGPEALKENAIDLAFNEAMASLSQVSDSLKSLEVLPHFIRG